MLTFGLYFQKVVFFFLDSTFCGLRETYMGTAKNI